MASITGMLAYAVPMSCTSSSRPRASSPASPGGGGGGWMGVECSSRPQKKATAHHMKTRPKKTQPWDVKRKGPTAYPPLPVLPPDWTLVPEQEQAAAKEVEEAPATAAE
ncbi:unnamed protein product [Musa acuminata subsp. malaccensis]|uniref:(wild Malaysian banana) hypothetical protein n=1 Tax=Musa acuminata subsp. malaccensis TaxID=214687 RepID=A0A804IGW8_MUSAM|nr:PREDICTED: 50S ribosomal protein 6, chloroplastic-like [Musa acuminata subsp. malaccensis]CAG1851444.1 unnamed protein product [Musa acuminata subsp. malaccensis]